MRPIVKWTGGKTQLLELLRPIAMRATRRYVEPFLGGGAVALSLPPDVEVVASDVEPDLVECYEEVRYKPLTVARHLGELADAHSKQTYYDVRASVPLWAPQRAARFLYLNKMSFNGLFRKNRSGMFNVPIGKGRVTSLPTSLELLAFARQTRRWQLTSCDFEETIARAREGDVVYADPPYVGTHDYSSGFAMRDQVRLREALDGAWRRGATVATTNSAAARDVYDGWAILEIDESRRVAADVGRRSAAQCLLMTRNHG